MKKIVIMLLLAAMLLSFVSCTDNSEMLSDFSTAETTLSELKAGDSFKFGKFEQDGDNTNGNEDIEWLVLAREDGKVLAISKYILDVKSYRTQYEFGTWHTANVRNWLNSSFAEEAFSEAEQQKIAITEIVIPAWEIPVSSNQYVSEEPEIIPEAKIHDKLFLLNSDEAKQYFASDELRKTNATVYAKNRGIAIGENGNSWWFLRTDKPVNKECEFVENDGSVTSDNKYSYMRYGGIRPAMWLNIAD